MKVTSMLSIMTCGRDLLDLRMKQKNFISACYSQQEQEKAPRKHRCRNIILKDIDLVTEVNPGTSLYKYIYYICTIQL